MTFHELREGATGLRAIEALRHVATEAGNLGGQAAGRTNEQLLERYLDWTEEAERLLGNVFPEDIVSDLIHTFNYWAFRAASGASPRLTPLILREAESRRRALSELQAELQAEQDRWQHPPGGATLQELGCWVDRRAWFGPAGGRAYRGSLGLAGGRSHSVAWVGCMVWSTTASSSALRVSRSTSWRSRALNAAMVRAAS